MGEGFQKERRGEERIHLAVSRVSPTPWPQVDWQRSPGVSLEIHFTARPKYLNHKGYLKYSVV